VEHTLFDPTFAGQTPGEHQEPPQQQAQQQDQQTAVQQAGAPAAGDVPVPKEDMSFDVEQPELDDVIPNIGEAAEDDLQDTQAAMQDSQAKRKAEEHGSGQHEQGLTCHLEEDGQETGPKQSWQQKGSSSSAQDILEEMATLAQQKAVQNGIKEWGPSNSAASGTPASTSSSACDQPKTGSLR